MSLGERIRAVRKESGLTQVDFAKRLKIAGQSVSKLEKGENSPSAQTIAMICREFHVREEWLRTGEGPMREELSRDEALAAELEKVLTAGPEDFRQKIIAALVQLPPEWWSKLEEKVRELLLDPSAVADPPKPRNVHDWTPDEMAEEARRQAEAEREGGTDASSISGRGRSDTASG